MISIGVGAGASLAIVAALIAAGFSGGGSSLDHKAEPTSVLDPRGQPVDGGGAIDEATDVPVADTPEAATDQPTEEPVATEPAPTEPVEVATPTEAPIEKPTDLPTVVGGA